MAEPADPRAVVEAHIAAVNAGDVDALVAGLDEEVLFASGEDLIVGRSALRGLFATSFSTFAPQLEASMIVAEGETVACEILERVHAGDSTEHHFTLAAFFTVRSGRIVRVKVYRDVVAGTD